MSRAAEVCNHSFQRLWVRGCAGGGSCEPTPGLCWRPTNTIGATGPRGHERGRRCPKLACRGLSNLPILMRTITVEHAYYQCTMRVEGGESDDGNGGKDWEYPRRSRGLRPEPKNLRPTPHLARLFPQSERYLLLETYAPSCAGVPD